MDSLAERGGFELAVPISQEPKDNMMPRSSTRQTKCWERPCRIPDCPALAPR